MSSFISCSTTTGRVYRSTTNSKSLSYSNSDTTTQNVNSIPTVTAMCPPNVIQECRQCNKNTATADGPLDIGETYKSKTV